MNLLGVRVSALDMPRAVAKINAGIDAGVRAYVCVTGVHGVIECQRDATLRTIHNDAYLVTPDGMPLVWALNLAGHGRCSRVYGPDLMLAVLSPDVSDGSAIFSMGRRLRRLKSSGPSCSSAIQKRKSSAFSHRHSGRSGPKKKSKLLMPSTQQRPTSSGSGSVLQNRNSGWAACAID